jgi:hypothetical protein
MIIAAIMSRFLGLCDCVVISIVITAALVAINSKFFMILRNKDYYLTTTAILM